MKRLATFTIASVLAAAAYSHGFALGDLAIGHPFARPTVAGQPIGGGYLKIENKGTTADRLLGGSSPAANQLELHTMSMDGDVMRMRKVDAVTIPPGATVALEPGGYHLMFVGLKAPLNAGDKVPLTLRFEKAGEVTVEVWVEPPLPGAAPEHRHP